MKKVFETLLMTPSRVRHTVSILYLGVVAILSLIPSRTFKDIPSFFEHMDKIVHFLIYGAMAALLCWTFRKRERRQFVYYTAVILFCIGYGILMEGLQEAIHAVDRSFSWADIVANSAGAVFFIPIKERFLPSGLDRLEQA